MIRQAATESEIEAFLGIRATVDPAHPMSREVWDAEQKVAGRIDVLRYEGNVVVGCAFAEQMHGDPTSSIGWVSVRTLAEHRRRGHGTALLQHCARHLRGLGCTSLHAATASTTVDMLAFLAHHRFEEVGRMQDVELVLADAETAVAAPDEIEIVPLTEEHEVGAHAVALEADADIPTATPIRTGDLDRWRARNLDAPVERQLSFVALADGKVVGYAILGQDAPRILGHYMTGVARAYRGHGIAQALKGAQIAAAKAAGYERLRTQNDLANAPMRAVNERLGYRARLEWVHFRAPLLETVPDVV